MTLHFQDTAAHIASLMALDKSALPTDGGEHFNRLIFARSPYLLQHAENPVDWYEWGETAFAKAREENLPILLSIGYATCHWCHVMAHESFEDAEVASLLNANFICIKIDREERPDIDDFYMTVSQILTGSGGWPLNIFMTPDKRPFMAVTYLPKQKRGGMNGLMELLTNIAMLYREKPEMIEKNCRGIMGELNALRTRRGSADNPDISAISEKALQQLSRIYDQKNGGFGRAPKFPMPIYLSWLISVGHYKPHPPPDPPLEREGTLFSTSMNETALQMALHTLRKIRNGGIWDQLGGGIHRYSVDPEWLAPHFEKMLYDQAMLALAVVEAYQVTDDLFFNRMAYDIFTFVERELTSEGGAFFSALDADSEGVEGKFYIWDKEEIIECLGGESELFCHFFDVSAEGNFESHNILNIPVELDEFCRKSGLDALHTGQLLHRCALLLLQKRGGRIRPLRDEKIITSWNGLMIAALARGGIICEKPEYITRAAAAADFILASLRRADGRLLRCYMNTPSEVPAFLEDYAFLAFGIIELYEATLDTRWREIAGMLAEDMLELFLDPATGDLVHTGLDAEQMPARVSSDHDGVTPSSFSITAQVLLRLAWILDKPEFITSARSTLSGCVGELKRNPLGHLGALRALRDLDAEPVIATFSGPAGCPELVELLRAILERNIPHLAIRREISSTPAAVAICADGTCYPGISINDDIWKLKIKNIVL